MSKVMGCANCHRERFVEAWEVRHEDPEGNGGLTAGKKSQVLIIAWQ